jgi:hypothetical protein
MPTPSANSLLLSALDTHLRTAGIVRKPSDNAPGVPPLWVEPADGVPAPGDRTAPEADPNTTLGLFYSGGVVGARWERQSIIDVWIRCRGNKPMVRAQDIDDAIRDSLLGDDELRVNFLLAAGTPDELRVIEARVWRELSPLARGAEAYTYLVAYWFQVYRRQP